ncbi:MAG: hypothetical protein Q8O99_03395 [bacterium]|nr:hypothetical protein [bacterium]
MTNLESFVQEVEATEGKDDTDNLLKAETLLREMGKVKNQKEVWNIIRKNVNKEFTQLPSETQQNLLDACLGAFDLVQKSNDNFELTTSTDSKLNSNQSSFLDKVKA